MNRRQCCSGGRRASVPMPAAPVLHGAGPRRIRRGQRGIADVARVALVAVLVSGIWGGIVSASPSRFEGNTL